MTWYDIAGLIGVATILAGYAVATMGRLDPRGARRQLAPSTSSAPA